MFWQAIKHGDSLETLCREAPDLAVLDIGAGADGLARRRGALAPRAVAARLDVDASDQGLGRHRLRARADLHVSRRASSIDLSAGRAIAFREDGRARHRQVPDHEVLRRALRQRSARRPGLVHRARRTPGRWPDDLPDALVFAKYPDPIYPTGNGATASAALSTCACCWTKRRGAACGHPVARSQPRAEHHCARGRGPARMQPVERDGKPSFSQAVLVFRYIPDSPSSRQR